MRRFLAAGPLPAASRHARLQQNMPRKARRRHITAAVLCSMVLVNLQQHACFTGFKSSFQRRFYALSRPHGTSCSQVALRALSSGDALQVQFQGRWVDAVVDAQLMEGIKVHFALGGYEYHLLASTWKTVVQRPQQNIPKTSQMLKNPNKTHVLEEFGKLSADDWMDAEVLADVPWGLQVKVKHPWNNRSTKAYVRHGEFKPSPQLIKKAQVRVRFSYIDVKKKSLYLSMLPESFASDFASLTPDLLLNGTVTRIQENGLQVLVEPPLGSVGGPRSGFVFRQNTVAESTEASNGSAAEKDLLSRKVNPGDEVQVRVRNVNSDGKLYLSMRDSGHEALGTDMLEAIVTNVSSQGLKVSVQQPGSDTIHHGFVPASGVSWGKYDAELQAVGQKVKARLVDKKSSLIFSMLEKQDLAAWDTVPQTRWFQGIVANVSSEFPFVKVQLSEGVQPVLGIMVDLWEDENGNPPNLTVGQSTWVRVRKVLKTVGKLLLTSSRVRGCQWIEKLPAGTWLNATVRRPCSDGWIVRVQEPMGDSNGGPGHSCRVVLPHSEIEDDVAQHATVRVRLLSMQDEKARLTAKAKK